MGAALVLLLVGLGAMAAGVLIGRYYVPDDRQLRRTARHSKAYMRALSHLVARDHETVISELRNIVEENVEDAEPYFALGAIFRSRGEHERAIRVHQALAVRERDKRKLRQRAMYELGLDFRAAGMPRRATRAMEEVVIQEPGHEGALRVLAALYEEQARFNEAAGLWQRLGRRRGEDTSHREHHLLVAAAQSALGREDLDSAKQLLKAAQKHEESAHFYAAAAELAAARGNHRGAKERLKQALIAEPALAPHLLPGLIAAEQGLSPDASDRSSADDLDDEVAVEAARLAADSRLALPAPAASSPAASSPAGSSSAGSSSAGSSSAGSSSAGSSPAASSPAASSPAASSPAGSSSAASSSAGSSSAGTSSAGSSVAETRAARATQIGVGATRASTSATAPTGHPLASAPSAEQPSATGAGSAPLPAGVGSTQSAAGGVSIPSSASVQRAPDGTADERAALGPAAALDEETTTPRADLATIARRASDDGSATAIDSARRAIDDGAARAMLESRGNAIDGGDARSASALELVEQLRAADRALAPAGGDRVDMPRASRSPTLPGIALVPALRPSASVTDRVLQVLAEIEAQTGPRLELALIRAQLVPPQDTEERAALARELTARFPEALAARVATARLAMASGDAAAIRAALDALVAEDGALAWALRGRWQCAHCGHRPGAFSWRCGQCRRWGTLRMETGVEPPPVAPRERRAAPRAVRPDGLLGASPDDSLPSATLDPGLSESELATAGVRRSLLGRVGGWVSSVWRRGA